MIAFSEPSDRQYHELLGLIGETSHRRQGFITQAKHFYQNALEQQTILDKLSHFSITAEKLQAGLTGLEELERLYATKVAVSSEVQRAVVERDDACRKLHKAYSNFRKTTKVVLREAPQLRETLGIMERNTPIRKRTAEGQDTQNDSTILKMVKDSSVTAPAPKTKEPEKNIETTESGE
ncbi:MAG: hypothetical protein ACM3SY_06760 [Candidatus Omnitrophota bacterium]